MVESKHRGAHSELVASAWLLDRGYEVFRNVSQHGKIDIIALQPKTGELLYIDVKTAAEHTRKDGSHVISSCGFAPPPGIKLLLVMKTGEVFWNDDAPGALPLAPRNCDVCGLEFERTQSNQRFCSVPCRKTFYSKKYTASKGDGDGIAVEAPLVP